MFGLTLFALLTSTEEWKSSWLNDIKLERGKAVNLQIRWRDTVPKRQYILSVHPNARASSDLIHSVSFDCRGRTEKAPWLKMEYLGKSKEPILTVNLGGDHDSSPKFIAFKGGKPYEDKKLEELLSPYFALVGQPRPTVVQGRWQVFSGGSEAGLTFKRTGISPWHNYCRFLTISDKREYKFSPWVEEPYSGPDSILLRGGRGKDAYKVRLSKSNFRFRGNRVSVKNDGEVVVNGMPIRGVDLGMERDEESIAAPLRNRLKAITVNFAGRTIQIPKRLVADCFNVHFDEGYSEAWLSGRQRDLYIQLYGADGGAGYVATFRVGRDGRVTRNIQYP